MLKSKPVKLTIRGDFWDSHLYSGWLYLFGADKSLRRIDWEYLIRQQSQLSAAAIVVNSIFIDAGFLYAYESQVFLGDSIVHKHVETLIGALQGVSVEIKNLDGYAGAYRKDSDSPFPELHTDFEIYHRKMYAGMPEGLYSANGGLADSSDLQKLWDAGVYAVKASHSYGTIALAAADEGLWEYDIRATAQRKRHELTASSDIRITTQKYCTACDWAEQSIFAWGAGANGFLASFYTQKLVGESRQNRIFDKAIDARDLHGFEGSDDRVTFWGSHDRAYALQGDEIAVLDYNPKLVSRQKKIEQDRTSKKGKGYSLEEDQLLLEGVISPIGSSEKSAGTRLKLNQIDAYSQPPVAVSTAPFGTVMQFGDRLLVFRSDGELEEIKGNIVSWKTFPRARNYSNQLHVIFDDRMEIYTFIHDFFVSQSEKIFGYGIKKNLVSQEKDLHKK